MIRFKHVSKRYGDQEVLSDLNMTIQKGEFLVLVGPSGCGKTTTLKLMNRLIPLTGGSIEIDERNIETLEVESLRWNMGYVLQQIALFPHMTIEENIALVPQMKKWSNEQIKTRVQELMTLVGLPYEEYHQRYPDALSGGQQQRIGVARALAADPDILLMDEPFSALDPLSREKLQDELLDIQANIQKTIVFVTHDMNEALKLADRICLLNDGAIEQIGTPQQFYETPKNDFVKQFMQRKKVTIKQLMMPVHSIEAPTIPSSIDVEELLHLLTNTSLVHVIENGQKIGTIEREHAFRQLGHYLDGRGDVS